MTLKRQTTLRGSEKLVTFLSHKTLRGLRNHTGHMKNETDSKYCYVSLYTIKE